MKKQSKRPVKQFQHVIRIFQPETVFGWHRQLIKRKWTHAHKNKVERPRTADEVKKLVIQLALDNDDWGYGKISGELEKLGIELSETVVDNILRAEGIESAPVRAGAIGWKTLMRHYREQLLATDFFTVETIFLKTIYVFFMIELGTRRVYLVGITQHPNGHWVTQQARNQIWVLQENDIDYFGLIRDTTANTQRLSMQFSSQSISTSFATPIEPQMPMRWLNVGSEACAKNVLIRFWS